MSGERLKFPFTWRELTPAETARYESLYQRPITAYDDLVVSEPGGIVMPRGVTKYAEDIYNMELRPDDVWIITYPKCGTTWTQEMVWQILHNFDPEGGREPLFVRSPFMEMGMFTNLDKVDSFPETLRSMFTMASRSFADTVALASPRCIKTHLTLPMLPPKLLDTCKVIFVSRNPKDCCVSYFNHERLIPIHGYTGDFATFAKLFKDGKLVFGDYWYHLEHMWKNRNHPNVLLLWFEDMKKDLLPIIRQTAAHVGKHLTELRVLQLDDHLYFDNFKKNPSVNMEMWNDEKTGLSFIRKGKTGDWKNYFTDDVLKEWQQWIEEKKQIHGITSNMV